MYTTTWCGYCYRLKAALKSAKISYAEVDIERDPAAAEFVRSVNGGNQTVPTVKFDAQSRPLSVTRVSVTVPLAAPVMRHVARTEFPSTRAATIRIRSCGLSRFTSILCLSVHE